MSRIYSEAILASKGYSYIKIVAPSSEPQYIELRFKDIVPEFSSIELGDLKLYKHQYEAYSALGKGLSIVLKAGTGSGKTEAWALYFLDEVKKRSDFHVLALYPTLALANDQIKRLEKYLGLIGKKPVQLDSVRKEEHLKKNNLTTLRLSIASSNLIITNPAFLLHDLKKFFVKKEAAYLAPIYSKLDLLVVDELDFYGPRSLALLLAMIYLLSSINEKKLQVAVLSAGIANPGDLCHFIRETTSGECRIIEGEPFKVENHTYIVLGKNLELIWQSIRNQWNTIVSKHPELNSFTSIIHNFDEFKKQAYKVTSILEGLGYSIPSISIDPHELISEYFNDEYVTLVFTRSIGSAEELVKSLKMKYGEKAPIAAHHHLVPKKTREEIEEKARKGEVKVIVSPRTLSQGIDIGVVARVIHLGLPDDVREYYQREGRKGRRRELGFSETIIVPYSRWDKELLSSGLSTFNSWLNLGLEKTLVNPRNLYMYLFTGVIKLKSPWFKMELNNMEIDALRSAGVLTSENKVNEKMLRDLFEKINFYEYAPPYGIKRYLEKEGALIPLEPIGHVDLVEKFQPGCIDYGEEAIVTALNYGKSTRYVRSVVEKRIRDIDFRANDALAQALEEYRYIKLKWNETPSIIRDLLSGRITSEELCIVYTPRNGFGKYIKIPERCIWTIRSEKPKYMFTRGEPVVYYDKRTIYVPTPTGGEYRDFTYGYTYSIDPRENPELLRLALSYLVVLLRRYLGIPLYTILYDVVKLGEYKYFSLHEPEAAGIIENLDWLNIRRIVEQHSPSDLDRILISEVDDIAYSTLVTIEFNWDLVKTYAIRAIDYILARDKIKALIHGKELYIPRPSPALRILSYVIVSEVIDEESLSPTLITAHGFFDGEKFQGSVDLYPPVPLIKPPQSLLELENLIIDKVFYEEYKLLVENREVTLMQLKQANLRRLISLLENNRDAVIDASVLIDKYGVKALSIDEVASALGLMPSVNYAIISNVFRKIGEHRKILDKEKESILKYLEEKSKMLYIAHLALNELVKQ
ncbi:MAG: helicase-related protein [Desulfurococcaceae archaeon]